MGKFVHLPLLVPLMASMINVSLAQPNNHDTSSYILGPGDSIFIELLDIPELTGLHTIGPDGNIYLPRLRALSVEGLTIDELRLFVADSYKEFVINPEVYITPVAYRSVNVYVGGEVARPGYYDLQINSKQSPPNNQDAKSSERETISQQGFGKWPTLFDALRQSQGITPYSNLSEVRITRSRAISRGGGKVQAKVDFLRLISNGDESVNIKIFDGDAIFVPRSNSILRDQLLKASDTNLSPSTIEVFVSGRVQEPGPKQLPQGSTLNQAIASAGGPKLLRGSVDFLRITRSGDSDKRRFSFNGNAATGDYKNPVLLTGDIIRVNDSILSAGVGVLNEITGPAVGIYSVYSLFSK